jgi:hypothetical protein
MKLHTDEIDDRKEGGQSLKRTPAPEDIHSPLC